MVAPFDPFGFRAPVSRVYLGQGRRTTRMRVFKCDQIQNLNLSMIARFTGKKRCTDIKRVECEGKGTPRFVQSRIVILIIFHAFLSFVKRLSV